MKKNTKFQHILLIRFVLNNIIIYTLYELQIKIIGVIVNVQSDQDDTCITYEICDSSNENDKMAPHFTVIRYQGVDVNFVTTISYSNL